MSRLVAYLHPTCTTCDQARQWLQRRKVSFVEKDIRATAPTIAELRAMQAAHGGERKKLLNTSGLEYRRQGLAAKLPGMADADAHALLATNGMFIKRPFVIGPKIALVGFKEAAWEAAFEKA